MTSIERNELRRKAHDLASQNCSWTHIGSVLGVHRTTAKRLAEEFLEAVPEEPVGYPVVSGNNISLDRFQPMHVYGDAVISCDWHIPLHDPGMVNSLIRLAYEQKIKKLVIAGDLFNMDSTSQYLPHQREANLTVERADATEIMDALLDVFEEIDLSSGNHDFRLVKFWNHTLDFDYLVRWMLADLGEAKLARLNVSYLDYLIYHPSPDHSIYVCHPENFSNAPLTVARSLVPKYGMSVLTAHSHHFAQGVALDGRNLVFDGGGLFSLEKTEYIKRTNKHHFWAPGFHVFKDGVAYPYSPLYRNL